jgi:hypothetical protein
MNPLKSLLEPVSLFVATLDLDDAEAAEAALNAQFPPQDSVVLAIDVAAREALASGAICHRGEDPVRFSRVAKPDGDPGGCSIDAVHMINGVGPAHVHTEGEVCLCIPLDGHPTFDGESKTWMVLPKGSRHAPRVEGGTMLILYWWPRGAVAWE